MTAIVKDTAHSDSTIVQSCVPYVYISAGSPNNEMPDM